MQTLNEDPNWGKKSLLSREVRQEERVLLCLLAWKQFSLVGKSPACEILITKHIYCPLPWFISFIQYAVEVVVLVMLR